MFNEGHDFAVELPSTALEGLKEFMVISGRIWSAEAFQLSVPRSSLPSPFRPSMLAMLQARKNCSGLASNVFKLSTFGYGKGWTK